MLSDTASWRVLAVALATAVLSVLVWTVVIPNARRRRRVEGLSAEAVRPPPEVREEVRGKCRNGATLDEIWNPDWDKYKNAKEVLLKTCKNGRKINIIYRDNKLKLNDGKKVTKEDCRRSFPGSPGVCLNPVLANTKPCRNSAGTECCLQNGKSCEDAKMANKIWNITRFTKNKEARDAAKKAKADAAEKAKAKAAEKAGAAGGGNPEPAGGNPAPAGAPAQPGDNPNCRHTVRRVKDGKASCPPGYTDTGRTWGVQCQDCTRRRVPGGGKPRAPGARAPGAKDGCKYTRRRHKNGVSTCPADYTDTGNVFDMQCKKCTGASGGGGGFANTGGTALSTNLSPIVPANADRPRGIEFKKATGKDMYDIGGMEAGKVHGMYVWEGLVAKVYVPAGKKLILYSDPDGAGEQLKLKPGSHDLKEYTSTSGGNWSTIASSYKYGGASLFPTNTASKKGDGAATAQKAADDAQKVADVQKAADDQKKAQDTAWWAARTTPSQWYGGDGGEEETFECRSGPVNTIVFAEKDDQAIKGMVLMCRDKHNEQTQYKKFGSMKETNQGAYNAASITGNDGIDTINTAVNSNGRVVSGIGGAGDGGWTQLGGMANSQQFKCQNGGKISGAVVKHTDAIWGVKWLCR